jgi:hypothetical protein
MSPILQQAWLIFRKDLRYLGREITVYLGLVFVACWTGLYFNVTYDTVLVMLGAAYLISRLIHGDAPAGTRQFWITRPYRRSSLLAAKLFFVVVVVDLPILFAQWLILAVNHFSFGATWVGLIWEQFLWFFGLSLPLAALAAMNTGMVQFVGSSLAAAGIMIAATWSVRRDLGSMEWIRDSLLLLGLMIASSIVIYLQYKKRNTRGSIFVLACLSGICLPASVFLPWTAAFAIQQRFSPQAFDASKVQVSLDPERVKLAIAMTRMREVQIAVPLVLEGFDSGAKAEGFELSIQASDGRAEPVEVTDVLPKRAEGNRNITVNGKLNREFFDDARNRPITLRGSLYFTVFGNRQSPKVYRDWSNSPVAITDRLRCSAGPYGLICESPFRWPRQSVRIVAWNAGIPVQNAISYSPFPGQLRFFPFAQHGVPFRAPGADTDREPEFLIEIAEPIAYVRREFAISGVRLTDIAVPWRSEKVIRDGKMSFANEY